MSTAELVGWKTKQGLNCLLTKDDIGRAKPSARDLPETRFTYGKAGPPEKYPVGILTSSWNFHTMSYKKRPDKDFKELNRIAVKEKAHTSHRQYEMRQLVDLRLRQA